MEILKVRQMLLDISLQIILRNVIFQSDLLLLLQDLFGCQFLYYIYILVLYMQIHVWNTL